VVLNLLYGVVIYRLSIVTALYVVSDKTAKANTRFITSVTASAINFVVCMILSKVSQEERCFPYAPDCFSDIRVVCLSAERNWKNATNEKLMYLYWGEH